MRALQVRRPRREIDRLRVVKASEDRVCRDVDIDPFREILFVRSSEGGEREPVDRRGFGIGREYEVNLFPFAVSDKSRFGGDVDAALLVFQDRLLRVVRSHDRFHAHAGGNVHSGFLTAFGIADDIVGCLDREPYQQTARRKKSV